MSDLSNADPCAQGVSAEPESTPLPRHIRKPPRAKEDRGLPPDEELAKLARIHRKTQMQLWPELVTAGILHEATKEEIASMVTSCFH